MKSAQPFALACAIAALCPTVSFALGIRLADQDARATARGNAFSATADNPSAIYYNPAGISQLYAPALSLSTGVGKTAVPAEQDGEGGLRLRMGLYAITLGSKATLGGGAAQFDISHRWQEAGNIYATWKAPNSKFTFGLGIYSPYGFGIWYPENWPLRQFLNYAKTGLKIGIFPTAVGDSLEFEGAGWAVGANAGIMWKPSPKHSFGIMYRSETQVTFDGHANTTLPGLGSLRENATTNIIFPQNIVFGYSFRPTPRWNIEFNADWTDWDRLDTVTLNKASSNVTLPFNWQSSFFYEFGATYQFDHGFSASAGYIYSENSVPNASFNPIVPDSNRHIFSFGLGKKWNQFELDLAYQYAHGPARNVTGPAAGTYEFDSHAISLSAGYRF